MPDPTDFDARLRAVEERVEIAIADAAAARHLAAARDRDLSDLTVKVDATRAAMNALGVQTAARFDRLEREMREGFAQVDRNFAQVDRNFATVRHQLDQAAAGHQSIADMLAMLIERGEDRP